MKDNLENNSTDLFVTAAKSILGSLPIGGSILAELIGTIVPNQRIDRLAKYVKELEAKFANIPEARVAGCLKNDEFVGLVEEGFIQAARATSDERRKYIASVVANSITEEAIEFQESRQILRILSELNDIEIIWLRFYLVPGLNGDTEFRECHRALLEPVYAYTRGDEINLTKAALQDSYKDHLERLELIAYRMKIDSATGIPEFDGSTSKPKRSSPRITVLGRLLLKHIGLIDSLN